MSPTAAAAESSLDDCCLREWFNGPLNVGNNVMPRIEPVARHSRRSAIFIHSKCVCVIALWHYRLDLYLTILPRKFKNSTTCYNTTVNITVINCYTVETFRNKTAKYSLQFTPTAGCSKLQLNNKKFSCSVIADRTAYDVRYSYSPMSGIAVVSMSIYLFAVSNWSLLLMSANLFVVCGYTIHPTVKGVCWHAYL